MATTPTAYDPKTLAAGTLGTTLTTTLFTSAGTAGDRITGILLIPPKGTSRQVTIDISDGTGRKLLDAVDIPADGVAVNVLNLVGLPEGFTLDNGDLIRGGQASGTDVVYQIIGWQMDD